MNTAPVTAFEEVMSMTKCPQCGAATSSAQRFCGECGTRLQHETASQQASDDRNAVPHRPGGGKPDPWDVGAIDDSDNGDDDFFSRFRPKSAVSGEEQIPAAPRRSRRRFEPDLNGDGPQAPTPPSVPPLFEQPPFESPLFEQHTDPQTAAPASAQAQEAAAEQERAQEQARQEQERARQEQARIREQQERALQEQERVRQEQARALQERERARQEQEVRARQEQAERERRAAEERALQVQALKEQQTAREAAERQAQFEQTQKPAQNQGQAQNQRQAQNQQMPSLPAFSPNAPAEPDDATFTQLITGLDNDPADKPILADGFDRTGIVPLPPRQDDTPAQGAVSDAERQTQQRAAEFYGTGAVDPAASQAAAGQAAAAQAGAAAMSPRDSQPMPSLPPLDADGGGDSTWGAAAPGEVSDQTAVLPSAQSAAQSAAQPAAQQQDWQSPFGSPFVSEARTPEDARRAAAHQAQNVSQASTPQTADEDFWPFGDELDDAHSDAEGRNRYQSGAGSAAAGAGSGDPAPGYDFGVGGGAGRGSGGRGGSGGSSGESEQKRRGLKTILIAAVAAVVVIIGAFVISGLVRGGDEEAPVADQTEEQQDGQASEQPTESETNEETPTEEPETQAPADFEPVTFQSGSGNLRCQITPEGGAACQILQQNFSTPDEACTTGGNAGVAVGVNEQGITWPCLTGNLGGGQVLDYDEPVSAGDYTCSINFTTGVSCENSSGASFSLEFNSGVETNGDTAADPQFEIEPVY